MGKIGIIFKLSMIFKASNKLWADNHCFWMLSLKIIVLFSLIIENSDAVN